MHELRKKVLLESGKTLSKKAKSRPESGRVSAVPSPKLSPNGSRPGSRPSSRPVSRQVSDDEDGYDFDSEDDIATVSSMSMSDENGGAPWAERLRDRIGELQDRKRSSAEGRVTTLKVYIHLLRHNYAEAELHASGGAIVTALLKTITGGGSTEERILAVIALTLTTLTLESEHVRNATFGSLNTLVDDPDTEAELKVEAILAMTVVTLYGGGLTQDSEELLQSLMDIVQTDGGSINSEDSAQVVVAALRGWGFVASHLDDISDYAEEALEMFVDQLESNDVDVQGAAGNNIGFLYEASREHEEETGETLALPVDPKRLTMKLNELARGNRWVSKKNRRTVRNNFASIATSLELGKGPGWSTAIRDKYRSQFTMGDEQRSGTADVDVSDDAYVFGYREKWKVGDLRITVDSWSLKSQVETFRTIFKGGIAAHLVANPAMEEIHSVSESNDSGD